MKKLFFLPILFLSCDLPETQKIDRFNPVVLQNIDSLASLYSETPEAKDTVFMGFRFGMSKNQFRTHIGKLRKEGHKIEWKNKSFLGVPLGNQYVLNTPMSMYDNVGYSEVVMWPQYTMDGKMVSLELWAFDDWSGDIFTGNWLYYQLKQQYGSSHPSKSWRDAMEDAIRDFPLDPRSPKRISETAIVYEKIFGPELVYHSYKHILSQILIDLQVKETNKKKSKEITF